MKIKFFLRMIFYSLLRRRLRMLVALIAVAVGVTVYREVPQQLGREFRAYGANLILTPKNGEEVFDEKNLKKVEEILKNEEVIGIAPFLYEKLEINKQYILTGGTNFEEIKKVSPYWQIEGRFPEKNSREILIGSELAKIFSPYEPKEILGQEITISAGEGSAMKKYLVTGIVSTGGKEEEFAFINLDEMQKIAGKSEKIGILQLSVVTSGENLKKLEKIISEKIPEIEPQTVRQIANSEYNVLSKLQILVFLVTLIVLILTLICVSTTMMAVVTERRKEIGLKKALGAANENIVREFLGEGFLLGLFGGICGSFLGYIFAESVSMQVFGRGIYFSIPIAILAIILSIFVTGVASLIPVKIAVKVDPAIVLRGE